jgi:hypothetical protein
MELGVLDKPPFEESLRELTARRLAAQGHPSPEDLAAYRAGDLGTEQHERIKDHLAICEDCSQLVLDLADFEQFEPGQNLTPADAQAEVSWQRLRDRLKDEGELDDSRVTDPAPILAPHPSRRRVPIWQRPAIPWALAAGLALCVVGLGLRVGSLGREVGELSAPSLNASVEDLVSDQTRGETPAAPVLQGGGVLVLTPSVDAAEYEVEVMSAADGALKIGPLRGPAKQGILTLSIPKPALAVGKYTARLYAIENGQRHLLEELPFEISSATP